MEKSSATKRSLSPDYRMIDDRIRVAKKRVRPHGSFEGTFWSHAAEYERAILERLKVDRQSSMNSFPGAESEWLKTDNAKYLLQSIHARETRERLFSEKSLRLDSNDDKRSLRAYFMKLYTTSTMGLGIKGTGAGKRDGWTQTKFKQNMIQMYDCEDPVKPGNFWCPVLATWCLARDMVASHIFPSMHGQDAMDSIFGSTTPPELHSPQNGLMLHFAIEEQFDNGKIVIVPDVPNHRLLLDVQRWLGLGTREYKIRIIDWTWEKLDKHIPNYCWKDLTWRQLDGKKLQFRTSFRPRARYLYFHYCVQVLRHAWQQTLDSEIESSIDTFVTQHHEPCWATSGKYINKKMLRSFVEELGHIIPSNDYKYLLKGTSNETSGDPKMMVGSSTDQATKRRSENNVPPEEIDSDDDGSESDDTQIYHYVQ